MTSGTGTRGHLDAARPLIVEMVGTPGAGKTTVLAGATEALRAAGWQVSTPEEAARTVVARTVPGRLVTRLTPDSLRHRVLWRLYLVHRMGNAGRAMARHPGYFARLFREQRRRPAGALARRRRVVHWLVRAMGSQEFFRRHAMAGEAVIFDEGLVHRVVQLFSSPLDHASPATVDDYLDVIPRPDLLVAVRCPVDVCIERVDSRGVWERLGDLGQEDVALFVRNAARVVDHAVSGALVRGWPVVEIDNGSTGIGGALAETARLLKPQIPATVAGTSLVARPLYRLRLSRPRRLARTMKGRLTTSAISREVLETLLESYGLSPFGRAFNLPMGRRSNSVWVNTDGGKVVVRAYSDHWADATIRHEHSVLGYLEEMGYPATRVVARPDGDTVATIDGRRIAVYRFASGTNLTSSLLTNRAGLEARHILGRLLARLHDVAAEFHPAGEHHLALDNADHHSRIETHLDVLGKLAVARSRHSDAAWLRKQASGIADRLIELHSILADAALEVAVIHGDYGLHNVLMRRDGSAVVHDFELARRDWRLVDIVETLGRMQPAAGRALLGGYRIEAGGEPDDWRHLAEMWEYHRLGGAVRTWESYERRGDMRSLCIARARVEEAVRVSVEGVSRWL